MKIKTAYENFDAGVLQREYDAVSTDDTNLLKKLAAVHDAGLGMWIKLTKTQQTPIKILEKGEKGIVVGNGTANVVTCKILEELLEFAGEFTDSISGIILPLPEFFENYIWSASLEKISKAEFGGRKGLLDLFSRDDMHSKNRAGYFEAAERYVNKMYIKPLIAFSKKHALRLCFDLTGCKMECDLTGNFIDIFSLKEEDIDILIKDSFAKNFFISCVGKAGILMEENGKITKVEAYASAEKSILLIGASRGAKSFTYKRKRAGRHLELPQTTLCAEVCYRCDRIAKSGYGVTVCGEKEFEREAVVWGDKIKFWGKKFSDIFICNDCLFEKCGEELIAKMITRNIRINAEKDFADLE